MQGWLDSMKTALLALVSCVAFAQNLQFEIADVHEMPKGESDSRLMLPGRLDFRGMTLADLVIFAYNLDDDRVSGGPSWVGSKKFDVIAKSSPKTSREGSRMMLQALLADRFKLTTHTEPKPMDVFVMTVGKRLLLKESSGEEDSGCQGEPGEEGRIVVKCKNLSAASIAEQLHQMAGGYFTHPIVDATGLEGHYDFTMSWTGRGALGTALNSLSAFDAVDKQLGLKIEPGKRPVPTIVIDTANETPTPNAPGAAEALVVKETEFEVADIKPSKPDSQMRGRFQPNGRIDFTGTPLKQLIKLAYNFDDDDRIVAPKWLDSAKFDIVAKVSTAPPIDTLRLMMKTLLIDRFKIESHMEDRPVQAYAMVIGKRGSKLEKATGGERAGCKGAMENEMIAWTCKNTTMAQLAQDLSRIAGGYVSHPVVDSTGLEGGYNFVFPGPPATSSSRPR